MIYTDHKEIGSRLRRLRGEQDAKSVAKALGIRTSALFMYERGERSPRDQVKMKIARYYGLPVQEIFFSE
nr:helix-turn-helix transcriptional regulator [Faecalibacterium sp. An192]